jgi:dCTP deaminase
MSSLKNDIWILEQAKKGMISPFEESLVRGIDEGEGAGVRPVLSYGISSYGYDIRLSPNEFKIFRHIPGTVVNPKAFNPENLEPVALKRDIYGDYFILPAFSYGLGVSLEKIQMLPNVTAICLGKSTYARCGIIVNCTPLESKWRGHITLEFSNASSADCRIYANEGVALLLFFEGEPCRTTYDDRRGKYQGQKEEVTLPRV